MKWINYGVWVLALILNLSVSADEGPEIDYGTAIATDGVPLATMTCGTDTAPTVLFLHGFSLSYESFSRQFTRANCLRWHMVAFDLRAHGRSGKPWSPDDLSASKIWADDVATIIEAYDLNNITIVGWSFGGYVVLDYVRHHGTSKIKAINLVGSTGGLVSFDLSTRPVDPKRKELARLQASSNLRDLIAGAELSVSIMTVSPLPADEAEVLSASVLLLPPYARRIVGVRDFDNTDLVTGIDVPLVFTVGEKDTAMPISSLEALTEHYEQFRVSRYPNAGHMTMAEDPNRFSQELDELIMRD